LLPQATEQSKRDEPTIRTAQEKQRASEQGKVAAEAAQVLYIGGGPYYFRDALKQIIPHLEVPRHPELANAQGYLAVGLQLPDTAWTRLRP
jgi:hypothetical protein